MEPDRQCFKARSRLKAPVKMHESDHILLHYLIYTQTWDLVLCFTDDITVCSLKVIKIMHSELWTSSSLWRNSRLISNYSIAPTSKFIRTILHLQTDCKQTWASHTSVVGAPTDRVQDLYPNETLETQYYYDVKLFIMSCTYSVQMLNFECLNPLLYIKLNQVNCRLHPCWQKSLFLSVWGG